MMLSNRKIFKNYLIFRILILSALAVSVYTLFFNVKNEYLFEMVRIIGISLSLALILYEYNHKPNLFEISDQKSGLIFSIYKPDIKYLFIFKESKIKKLEIDKTDLVHISFVTKLFGLSKSAVFTIGKRDAIIKTDEINLDFFTSKDVQTLINIINRHNLEVVTSKTSANE